MNKKTETKVNRRGFLGKIGLGIVGAGAAVIAHQIPAKAKQVKTPIMIPSDQLCDFVQDLLGKCQDYGAWREKIRDVISLYVCTPPECSPPLLTLRHKKHVSIIHIQLPEIVDFTDYKVDSAFTEGLLKFIQGETQRIWNMWEDEENLKEVVNVVFDPRLRAMEHGKA